MDNEKFAEEELMERRMQGAFFTPTNLVDEAHRGIAEKYGENWKDEYVVWDCCSGTGNLTRDYKFKELYSSTLIRDEHDIKIQNNVNPEGTHFIYDFLSCIIEDTLFGNGEEAFPEGLVEALNQNKKIIIIMNPPYGTAGSGGTKDGDHKAGIAKTFINNEMKKDNMGACCQNLYPQFMYKIVKLKEYYGLYNINICQFSPTLFLTGGSYQKFRKYFFSNFKFEDGFSVCASVFSDVSSQWGILFSMWSAGQNNYDEFKVKLLEKVENEDCFEELKTTSDKILYNLDGKIPASKWVREEVKDLKTYDAPQMSSGIKVKEKGRGKSVDNALGYFANSANNICANPLSVFIVSSASSAGNGLSIIPENFNKVVSLFTARRLITGKYADWINDKDEYSKPDENHKDYEQWNNDCIIYSLFNTASNQSSLRDVDYKGKTWQIENEFFWLSPNFIKDLADKHSNNEVYKDVKQYGKDRFVYDRLKKTNLSEDAKNILNKATELLEKTFKYREMLNEEHPEYNLQAWDASWYQVKLIAKEYCKEDLKEFSELYKAFGDRLRPLVYELGFLREYKPSVSDKLLYNLDNGIKSSDWVREEIKGIKTYDAPQISSAIRVKQKGIGRSVDNALGYFVNNANSIYYNSTIVYLMSECSSGAHGLSVIPENFNKVVSLFTARRLITGKYANWINDKDEYSKPDEIHVDYKQWNNDSIIYSLFNTASNQSSLRDVDYKGKTWQIENEFFWLSPDFIKDLADKHSNNEVYKDVKQYGKDRFVYNKLKNTNLSDDAKNILNKATELLVKTFQFREMLNEEHPEYNLQAWDASWYQVKLIAKEYCKEDLKEFSELYKAFGDRLRPLVYELGFLRK